MTSKAGELGNIILHRPTSGMREVGRIAGLLVMTSLSSPLLSA